MTSGADIFRRLFAVLLLLAALAYWWFSGFFGKELLTEIAILAIFAMSLDLLVGYTGLVSLGHAAFFGIGAYATGGLTVLLGWPMALAMPASILIAGAAALVVGFFVIRLSGVFFIMITLAVGQMFHAYFFKNKTFGRDDGMSGTARLDLSALGIDFTDPAIFALLALVLAAISYLLLSAIVRSPFGHVLVAIRQNENRIRALGCPVQRYKLAAYTVAAMFAGLAGSLTAQHTGFISPELYFWTTSGEVLIMVIVGGMGSLLGPAAGAALIILLRDELSSLTEYWLLWMGLFFVLVVLFAGEGLYGLLQKGWRYLAGARPRRAEVGGDA
jgi:branched-chain amino acid transport system permease protein